MALYEREGTYIPRVAAVHDLCGYGKCSLGVAIPVLSSAGCDVCPVPTGLFSSHTAFPGWYMHDTTDILADYLAAWDGIGVEVDAVYSGFLGAPEQVDVIRSLYAKHPRALRMIDPVMADHGKIYPTYTPELCDAMVSLSCDADILTPNLTEAAIILGEPIGDEWGGTDITDEEAHRIVRALLAKGAKHVILKGIQREGEGVIRNFVGSSAGESELAGKCGDESVPAGANSSTDADANDPKGEGSDDITIYEVSNEYLPYMLHGTGDVYASCVLAAIMAGRSLVEAAQFAGGFVHDAMLVSAEQPNFRDRGVSFEPLLGKVSALLR